MGDFSTTMTDRLRVRYTVQGKAHSCLFRFNYTNNSDVTDVITKIQGWLAALSPIRYQDWILTGAEFARTASTVFLPIAPFPVAPGTASTTGRTVGQAPFFLQFLGKSGAGGRGGQYLYGTSINENVAVAYDYRIYAQENAVIAAALDALVFPEPRLVASDTGTMTYYPYVNVKASDHWVHKARQG